ncbi:unnamed protein product [Caretta caretta]
MTDADIDSQIKAAVLLENKIFDYLQDDSSEGYNSEQEYKMSYRSRQTLLGFKTTNTLVTQPSFEEFYRSKVQKMLTLMVQEMDLAYKEMKEKLILVITRLKDLGTTKCECFNQAFPVCKVQAEQLVIE